MATNPYFNHFQNTSEQNLHQDLIIEAIKNFGIDLYYLPREYMNEDLLYGEDTISHFSQAHLIEMYVKTVDGFEGEGDFISRFGLEIRDQVVFSVARRRWENIDLGYTRPREGDLIFLPLNKKLYEIRFVEHESMFYQFGKLPIFDLTCELFQYDSQRIDTGISDIDTIEDNFAYAIEVQFDSGGSGAFTEDEYVYVGSTIDSANTKGRVISWNSTDRVLKLTDIVGTFSASQNVVGNTSGAYFTVTSTPNTQTFVNDSFANNLTIQTESDGIIDFSESNPFSESNY
jgi:hypothetical protein